jgi:hypothetical protein
MRATVRAAVVCLWFASTAARAQDVYREEEILTSDRPEAWAMNYFNAATFMTAFGATPELSTWQWQFSGELGHVPALSESQQRVGFDGIKLEDLNKSPVFGRLRAHVGLPGGWVAELGYTPPLEINGARPRDLLAVGIGRRLFEHEGYSLSARAFGQHGTVSGDITCPGEVAGDPDPGRNPFGCQAPSDDRARLNHYGLDLTVAWTRHRWAWHVTAGVVRSESDVQVDAYTFDVHDRSHLVARGIGPTIALGLSREVGARWTCAMEVLHVPLSVRREPGGGTENDPLVSLRLRLSVRP